MTKQHSKKSKKRKIRSRIPPRPIRLKPQVVPEAVQSQPEAQAASPPEARLAKGGAKSSGEPRKQFPKISRLIPARLKKLKIGKEAVFWMGVGIACVLLVLVIFQAQTLVFHMQQKEQKEQGRAELMRQERYWMGVVTKYQDYRDGYYNIALLAYRLGEQGRAEENIQKALELDPNFKQGKELEVIIKGEK